jgi:regulatory protein
MFQRSVTKEQALQKAKHYCAYQERSHAEVKEKLYSFKLRKSDVEEILSSLIEEDYLNESRFATQYASGKFRMKHWGRIKIKISLTQKQVSAYNIKSALAQIDEAEYLKTIERLAEKKGKELKGETAFVKRHKIIQYLLQKGFENNVICRVLDSSL